MADITLRAAPFLGGYKSDIAGTLLEEQDYLALVSLAVPLGGADELVQALKSAFGLSLPEPTRSAANNGVRIMQITADQMMLVFPHSTPDACALVLEKLKFTAYATDQTDAMVRLSLSGPSARTALERLCPLDLHDGVFPVGAAARTVMEHMGAMILRTGDESYLLLSASSSAGSFLHAVETSLRYVS